MATSRRRFLGAASAALVAGCLGGGGDTPTGTSVAPDALPAPALGADSPEVVVRAWEDFACPHCRDYNEVVLPALREEYLAGAAVRYEHHDFPIPVTQWSWPAAIAARAVQDAAGTEAFWTFTDTVYANQDDLGWSLIREAARQAGADPGTVESQARGERWRPVVAADRQAGRERGVSGTPTVFVGDEQVPPGDSWEDFYGNVAAAIDDRLSA